MKDLAQRVAKAFREKPYKYQESLVYGTCNRCGQHISRTEGIPDFEEKPCIAPDPIDITDLGKALEVFRELPENLTFEPLMDWARQHCINGEYPIVPVNIMFLMAKGIAFDKATAQQIWEINCLAKESEELT